MSYGFIQDLLVEHFPRQNEMGDLFCNCDEYHDSNHDDGLDGMAERWAEHVEVIYNEPSK